MTVAVTWLAQTPVSASDLPEGVWKAAAQSEAALHRVAVRDQMKIVTAIEFECCPGTNDAGFARWVHASCTMEGLTT